MAFMPGCRMMFLLIRFVTGKTGKYFITRKVIQSGLLFFYAMTEIIKG
jgi:hypothetical protein